jgi:hypothetical protein
MPMKVRRSVLMTSLVPALTFKTPASAPQAAPTMTAAMAGMMKARPSGRWPTPPYSATAVAAMPPTAICPSPPTLVRLARSATNRLIDAAMTYPEPKAPSMKASTASSTGTPVAAMSARLAAKVTSTVSTGKVIAAGGSGMRRAAVAGRSSAVMPHAPTSSSRSPRDGSASPAAGP